MQRTKIVVNVNGSNTDYFVNAGTYSSTLAGDPGFKENFALGSNIEVLVNGSPGNRLLKTGDVVTVRQVASSKAADTKIVVNVNGSNTDYFVAPGTTAAALSRNTQFREDFALGSNVEVLVHGVSSPGTVLKNGDVVTVRQVASSKA